MNLHETIAHLTENAPHFAGRMSAAGLTPDDIQSVDDLAKLPVLSKDSLIEIQAAAPPFGGLLACEIGDLKRIYQSPGPIYEPEGDVPDYWRAGQGLAAGGFEKGELVFNAFSYHMTPAGAMFEEGLRKTGCTVIPGGIGSMEQQIEFIAALSITGFVGLPSYLIALLDKAAEMELTLPLQKAALAAEPLLPAVRAELKRRGLKVGQGYGTAECGILGFECEAEDGWHIPEDCIVQVCDINTGDPLPPGQVGQVVATLYNRHYALVRFGVGDLSAIHPAPCSCGRSEARLVGWLGRVGQAVKVRGMFLHPTQVASVLRRFEAVQAHQSVVTREGIMDHITLNIVLGPGADADIISKEIQAVAREALKFKLNVVVVDAADLPDGTPALDDQRDWD
jgi:phenylacetate-CoA ligase